MFSHRDPIDQSLLIILVLVLVLGCLSFHMPNAATNLPRKSTIAIITVLSRRAQAKEMASKKEPPGKSGRDSDSASEHQADVNRDAERVVADKAKRQSRTDSDASRDPGRDELGRR